MAQSSLISVPTQAIRGVTLSYPSHSTRLFDKAPRRRRYATGSEQRSPGLWWSSWTGLHLLASCAHCVTAGSSALPGRACVRGTSRARLQVHAPLDCTFGAATEQGSPAAVCRLRGHLRSLGLPAGLSAHLASGGGATGVP